MQTTLRQLPAVALHTVVAVAALILYSALWGSLRGAPPLRLLSPSDTFLPAPASPSNTNSTLQANVTHAAAISACASACGTGGACNQSAVTGVVASCVQCGSACVLPACRPECVTQASDCAQWPWCTTLEAAVARRLHFALVQASIDYARGNTSALPNPYPSTGLFNMTHSSNYTCCVASAGVSAAQAIVLVNLWTTGKVERLAVGDRAARAEDWLDDQSGWWNKSALSVWQKFTPADFMPYVIGLKQHACATHTWVAQSQSSACVAPSV